MAFGFCSCVEEEGGFGEVVCWGGEEIGGAFWGYCGRGVWYEGVKREFME